MAEVPYLTADQMRLVDRVMVEKYHIELIQMMENAGRNLAHLARSRFLNGDPRGRIVIVLAGSGGNGGGGFVCARRLENWGANVHVVTTKPMIDSKVSPLTSFPFFKGWMFQFSRWVRFTNPISADHRI